ncbi:GTPase domain-containing protein [Tissierella praeacuta]|uniref:GTPase domain-containing protein n=1 Tax=Tissierella praeacuta TaxID=43131 RepID=UPI002FD92DF7
MESIELKNVLEECEKSAKAGYKIALKHEKHLNRVLSVAEEKVRSTLLDFNSSPCYSPEATNLLEGQLIDIEQDFNKLSFAFKEDLENLRANMSKFSITLFGRTMAGKSTLMEILTKGDGKTIGKGAQRTTRDVRQYNWKGLEITDVPGIGAFEGEDDEQIAFEAAKKADLILFLITDDAPQASEADCFSRIINLGKPVVCIINVKASITKEKSIKLATRDIQKMFDMERLEVIRKQFLGYAEQFGQTWNHIPFVYVHLKSAYLAQHTEDLEQSNAYYQMSRIDYLENRITEQVKKKGEFFRIKTFIDIISNPILESMESLLNQSQINSAQGRTILAKKRQLDTWKGSFYRDSKSRINSLIVKIKSDLNSEIAAFAEEHFSDKNADKAWNKVLKERKIEAQCQELLEDFENKANEKLKEISREITNELKFTTTFAGDRALKMNKIFDGKKLWDWSSVIAGGGLSIAAGIAYLVGAASAGPLGWAALAVTGIGILGSFLFRSRDRKEFEARTKLEKNLRENVSKICTSLQTQMEDNLNSLISVRIEGLMQEMDRINSVIFRLADTQRELAWELNKHLLELNKQIVTEAIRLIGAEGLEYHIQSVARIPGNSSLFLLRNGTVFPKEQRNDIYKIMGERIGFVYETDNKKVLISRILGKEIDRDFISIEEKIGVAYIPIEVVTPNIINKVRLAQQFSKIQIIKQ